MKADYKEFFRNLYTKNIEYFTAFMNKIGESSLEINNVDLLFRHIMLQRQKKEVQILGLGAGVGYGDFLFVKKLMKTKKIKFDYLDPSKEAFKLFKEKLKKDGLGDILNRVYITTWEEFKEDKKYDLIISWFSWDGIGSWKTKIKKKNSLFKLYDYLISGGIGVIAINSEHDEFKKFASTFFPKIHGIRIDYAKGKELSRILDSFSINHNFFTAHEKSDITDCISSKARPIPLKEKRFISFWLCRDYDRLSTKTKEDINNYLIEQSYKMKGRRVMLHSNDFLIIKKPSKK